MISLNFKSQAPTAIIALVLLFLAAAPILAEPDSDVPPRKQFVAGAFVEMSAPRAFGREKNEENIADLRSRRAVFQKIRAIASELPRVEALPDLNLIQRKREGDDAGPPRIGVGVDIPELSEEGAVETHFHRLDVFGEGTLLGLRVHSPGAVGLRLGLLIDHIPADVSIMFAAPDIDEAIAPLITGKVISKLVDLNRAAGDDSDNGKTYWSPLVEGDEALILLFVPAGIDTNDLRFTIPQISHIFENPLVDETAAFCNLDVSCHGGWDDEASAVARMVFTDGSSSFVCTGTLLNDLDASGFIPYFLSANHCISTQTIASSLQTFWYYQSASCDDVIRDARFTTLAGGAQLLYGSATTDTAFMRLNDNPPPASYLGWTTAGPNLDAEVTGIHHPAGDWKKISFGYLVSFEDCWTTGDTTFQCKQATSSTGGYINANWSDGTTEGGSSGSPLLNNNGQVIGNLWGGNSSCSNPHGINIYGRFDLAYQDGLKQWLSCTSRFCDVPASYWAWRHIEAIANAGITAGCGRNLYCPENPVTRAQMAVFLLRGIHGDDYVPPAATGRAFSDVSRDYWAATWIEQFAREGITAGCGGGKYCPDSDVTRAEMAVFLLLSKHGSSYTPPPATGARFNDVPKSYWASSWIEQLATEGVTGGCGGGSYCPNDRVARDQMAVFIQKTLSLPLP